jgi:hypothetical protein
MKLELDDPETPASPASTNQLEFEVWKLDIKEPQIRIQEYSNFQSGL